MATIRNPILKGFNPDPSFLCVGEDYYIATSTFEWYPGVQIHHSRDLVHWELITRPLTRLSQLNLRGDKCSGGVWAPCLSYDKGKFYLIYSDVKTSSTFYDVSNYLVTAEDIMGPWSEPIFLNSSGFDPSLFHDEDGRKWLLNMRFDYRVWKVRFSGIEIQEYSQEEQRLIGEPQIIFTGTPNRITEGPHIYKRNNYYYLFCAEGGTVYKHAEMVLRSTNIKGPYELGPYNPLITTLPYPENELQKAGHASMVEGKDGSWYLAHLCGRPVGKDRYCILGRETALQQVIWEKDWPRLISGTNEPQSEVEIDVTSQSEFCELLEWMDDFEKETWNINFQTVRVPLGDRASLEVRTGYLRLYGKESLESLFEQSLLACRQQHFYAQIDTKLDFAPVSYQQTAGLTYYYDTMSHYYAYVTWDEEKGRVISMMNKVLDQFTQPIGVGIKIPDTGEVYLRLVMSKESAQFYYSLDGVNYFKVYKPLDATVLSDDYYEYHLGQGRYTGAFIGICCQDISGRRNYADFDFFQYKELESPSER